MSGDSPAVSTILALLCTDAPRKKVTYTGKPFFVATGERALPQGACTSPALSNQVAKKLDRRLAGMSKKHGWTYTRYADDLTFSGDDRSRSDLAMLLARVRHVVDEEGFARLMEEKKRAGARILDLTESNPTRAGLDYLARHARCTGRLGAMGICLGGHLAFRAAMNPDVLAAACFYATDIDTATLGKGDDSLKRAGDIKDELLTVWGFLHQHRAKPSGFGCRTKSALIEAAALCLNSVNGLRFP